MQYRFKSFVLDTAQFALYKDGQQINVEPQVFTLLKYLIENRDRVVSRTELLDKIFGRRIVTDNTLTVRIRALRRAVGDTAKAQAVIATIQGGGYQFISRVETTSHVSSRFERSNEAGPSDSSPSPLSVAQPSIAVLPFEVLGTDETDSIIARGLVHDVMTRIARSRTMFVIARGTAFQFPSGEQDVREVGARLGVRYLVQGAAQISRDKIRVSIGLANAETRQEVGSWQYDKKLGDVLVIQDEIANLVVAAIETEVQKQEVLRSTLLPSSNLDAWSAYHRGLGHMYHFRMKECDSAEMFFRRAIDLEPKVPRPYAGLSFVHYERAYLNLDKSRVNSLRRAFDYAQQALAIDPMDPMGHWALSRAHFLDHDLEAARESITFATDLNPSYATAQYFLGWVAMQLGDHETCLERIDLAVRLSPFDPLIYGMLGVSAMSLALMGRCEDAIERVDKVRDHPDMHYQAYAMGAIIFTMAGDHDSARSALQYVWSINPDYDIKEFFSVYAFQKDEDIRNISQAFEEARRNF
jgi:TolB-like protein/tetratricopeptide (TPR) repeat protein